MVQRARTDMSMADMSLEVSRIIMTRLVEDSGCISTGAAETLGSARAWVSRSETSWRARRRSVPGLKTIWIEDRPGTDLDLMASTQATPFSRSASMGEVMSCSTSAADSPRASVWISTWGGANSGKASTDMLGRLVSPKARIPAAAARTRSLNCSVQRTIARIMAGTPHALQECARQGR